MTRLAKAKITLYLAAIFLAGAVAGGWIGFSIGQRQIYAHTQRDQLALRMRHWLTRELQLTPRQIREIEPLLQQTAAELQSTHSNVASQICGIFKHCNQKLYPYLNPDQQLKLQELEHKREQYLGKPHPQKRH